MNNRKGSATTTVIVVLVVAVALGIGWYFTSDVFHTRINAAADGYIHWTPENIAKDPVNYLNFCEEQDKKALEQLKADRIRVVQSRGKLEAMRDDSQNAVKIGDGALSELKEAYQKNDASPDSATWPVVWHQENLDKDSLKRKIVTIYKETDAQRSLLNKAQDGLKTLEAQVAKIAEAESQAQQQLAEIAANRQLLDVNKLTDDLKTQLVNMKGAIQATVTTASETSGGVDLAQLVAQSKTSVDNGEFDKIVGKIK